MVKEKNETKVKKSEKNTATATLEKKSVKKYTVKNVEMKSKINNLKEELEEKNSSNEVKEEIVKKQEKIINQNNNKTSAQVINEDKPIKNIKENEEKNNSTFKKVEPEVQKKSKNGAIFFIIFLIIFLIAIFAIFGGFTIYNFKNANTISKGIYISGIEISDLKPDEAKAKLQKYYDDKLSNDITLIHNDYTAYIKNEEIELSYDIDAAIEYAYNIGKTHNIFSDNFQIFNAMVNGINITPTFSYNEEALEKILNNLSKELPDTVIESGYYIEGNNLIISKGKDGVVIDVDETKNIIKNSFTNLSQVNTAIELITVNKSPAEIDIDKIYKEIYTDAKDAYFTTEPHAVYPSANGVDFAISIDEAKANLAKSDSECVIPLKVLKPSVTTNMLGQEAFPDLLATFSTKYAASNVNRTTNLRLAANKINGYVLLPDEVFSYNNVVGERTIAAGYKDAAIYQNGEVVQGLGGGICQISTTLYNATLFANLEMVELHNHQFVPSYVGAGRDATVVYGVKDFKFKNTRKHAIKLTCSVSGGVATFNIWGYKEDVEYDISVYASVTSRTSSYIKSSTYRTIKQNGQIIKNENIINSTYKAH